MLKELCSEGYLVSDGIGRGTTYHLNKMKTLTVPMMIILRQILKKQLKRNIAKKNYLE